MLTEIKRILYCDDDEDDHVSFHEAMTKVQPGVELKTVFSGEALFKELSTTLPDIIFLDINIPVKNGLTCLKEIKSDDVLKHLRVIMHSTAQGSYVEESYALGANLYIPKPLSLLIYPVLIQKVFMLDWSQYIPQPSFKKFLLTEMII